MQVDIPGFQLATGVWLGEGAQLDPSAVVDGPAVIGDNCRVMAGARLGEYTVLGANVRVRNDADLERTVVHDNAYIGESSRLRGTIVGRACDLRRGVRCDEGSVLGDECFVADDAFVGREVKIYPFKTVEAGAVINSSIVWESKGARSLFGRDGVAGLANVDVTPELAVRLAMAYASTLKADTTVVTSRDSSRSARMLKRAMMAGLNSGGVNVVDLEVASVPVTRFVVRQGTPAGGVDRAHQRPATPSRCASASSTPTARTSPRTAQRKVERLFHREDFRRALPSDIGDIEFPPRAIEHYASALQATVDLPMIAAARFKVVIDYSYGTASLVMPNVLAKLGADVLAVNPFTSTPGVISFDAGEHARDVASLVRSSGANLGAVVEPDGERITFIDDRGRVLDDTQAAAVVRAAGVRPPARRPHRGARRRQRRGRGAGRAAGRAHRVHEDVHDSAQRRRHRARRRLRGVARRRLHPARVPARLRRRRGAGQDAGPAGPSRHLPLRGRRRAAARRT